MGARIDAGRIAATAVRIADAEGVDAVSMRRVGSELGVSGMALYRHVADREALLVRMAAHVAGERPAVRTDEPGDWRSTLDRLARATWDALVRHPWLLAVVVRPGRVVDLLSAQQLETVLERLEAGGFDPVEAFDAVVGVTALALGIAGIVLDRDADRRIAYAVDAAGPGDPDDGDGPAASPTPRADAARARPLDAAAGARLLDAALVAHLDGLARRRAG